MIAHAAAVAFTLATFLLLGLAYFGWGRALSSIVRVSRQTPDPIMSVWLGWAFTLLIFQTLHLFLPITAYLVVPILVFGVALSIPHMVNALRMLLRQYANPIAPVLIVLLGVGVAAWAASRAMLPPTNYDSGVSHFTAIRWINTYPLVPGLGNLFWVLGENQSFFTYVAALNFYPFFGHGRSLANSSLLLLLVATLFPSWYSVLSQPVLLTKRHVFFYAPDLFVLPIVGYLALSSNGLASPTPDLASILLQLTMFVMLARGIAEWQEGQREQDHRVLALVVLAATAVTVKLSNLAFSAVIIGVSLAYVWQKSRSRIRGAIRVVLPAVVIVLVWGFGGFVLSGAPFYPSTIGYVPVEWAVPREKAVALVKVIYGWARQPHAQPDSVLRSWNWLGPWIRMIVSSRVTDVVYPTVLAVLFSIIALTIGFLSFRKRRSRPRYLEWSILLPSVLGLAYWFFTAPDPRFAHALFWLLSLGSALVLLSSLQTVLRGRALLAAICVTFLAADLPQLECILVQRGYRAISVSGWYPVKKVPLITKETLSGLVVYTPENGDQCWDSPLPSTPLFNPDLRLRTPGNTASGFTVARQKKRDDNAEQVPALDGDTSAPRLHP